MEPNEEQLISIADKMLEQLEREYWQAQDKDKTIECPQDEGEVPEGYQMLDADGEEPDSASGES